MFLQCVRFKAVRSCIKVVTPDATDETLGLGKSYKNLVNLNYIFRKLLHNKIIHSTQPANTYVKPSNGCNRAMQYSTVQYSRAFLGTVLTSMSSLTCSCWSLSSPKASIIKPEHKIEITSDGQPWHPFYMAADILNRLVQWTANFSQCLTGCSELMDACVLPWMMASRITMTKKKKVMSKKTR